MSDIIWTDCTVRLGQLKPWGDNPKTSTKKDARALLKSWNELGQFQTIAIGPEGEVYDGHQQLSALLTVNGPAYEVAARRSSRPLTDEERRKVAIFSRQIGAWDWDKLSSWQPAELMEWGFDADLLRDWKRDTAALDNFLKSEQAVIGDEKELSNEIELLRVPDAIWGTDNDYGIPLLDISMQAKALESPFVGWGTVPRKNKMMGTYHFYVEDYRFEQLWKDPLDVANCSCSSLIEPNFSIYDEMPRAVALWQIYRKRWLSRWFQSVGINIFVDLNISERYEDLRFVGVPRGWNSYATRAYSQRLDATVKEYEASVNHSKSQNILFIVYGGGKNAEILSKEYGWIWFPDQQTNKPEVKNG